MTIQVAEKLIKKRTGKIVVHDPSKIVSAIYRAMQSLGRGDEKQAAQIASGIEEKLNNLYFSKNGIPEVEDVQDLVEEALMKWGLFDVAKSFIVYRHERSRIRNQENVILDVKKTIEQYLGLGEGTGKNWRVKENANTDFDYPGLNVYISGTHLARYALYSLYPPEIAEAHVAGHLHIHDLSNSIVGYCSGWSLQLLLQKGFGGVHGRVTSSPPKHLDSAINQMITFLGTLQNEFAGAQAFSVHPKETIVLKNKMGKIEIKRIGEFCDRYIKELGFDKDGIEFADISHLGLKSLSFKSDGNHKWNRVNKVIRHKITDPLHILKTNKGVINVSKNHSVFSLKKHTYLGSLETDILEMFSEYREIHSNKLEDYSDMNKELFMRTLQNMKIKGVVNNHTVRREDGTMSHAIYSPNYSNEFVIHKTKNLNCSKEVKSKIVPNNVAVLAECELEQNNEFNLYSYLLSHKKLSKITRVYTNLNELKNKIIQKSSLRQESLKLSKDGRYLSYLFGKGYLPLELYEEFRQNYNISTESIKLGKVRKTDILDRIMKGKSLESFLKLIAWYLSEGWAINNFAIGFTQGKSKYLKEIEKLMKELKCPNFSQTDESGKHKYVIGGFLGTLINNTCGKYCDNKKIPSFIFNLSNELKRIFVKEILKGDGHKRSTGWVYTSTSNLLITGLNLLIISMGYRTSIRTRFEKEYENYKIGNTTKKKRKLTRYDLIIHENKENILKYNDFESAVIFDNFQFDFETEYEYDLSIEDSETFIGGVGLFALHNSSVDTLLSPFIRDKFCQSVEKILRQTFSLKANGQVYLLLDMLYNYKKGEKSADEVKDLLEELYPNVIFSSVLMQTFLRSFFEEYEDNSSHVRQNVQNLIYAVNQTSRWGGQSPFVNLSFDWTVPDDLADQLAIVSGKPHPEILYRDCQTEIDIFNKVFIEEMLGGDKHNRIFTFPIPTYSITKNFDWDHPNVNLLMKITAKYGIPYFQNFHSSGLEPSSIRAMCCRLNLNIMELKNRPGGMWNIGDSTGSIGVVTINLNRLGYLAINKDDFFRLLRKYMDLAQMSLEIKRKEVTRNFEKGMMAYAKEYLPHGFKTYFSTIGLCGMHECCLNFLNRGINTPDGLEFAREVLQFMGDVCEEYKTETGNLYNLEASPAESTSYRFARLDKKWYTNIILSGSDETPYLTNSSHLPVDATTDLIEAIEHQNVLQPIYTGGTIFHTFIGEEIDPEVCKNMVRLLAEQTRLPYFSITPTFSICTEHKYIKGKHFECPHCGKPTETYSRIVGYFRPISKWNNGKAQEFKDRTTFEVNINSFSNVRNIIQEDLPNEESNDSFSEMIDEEPLSTPVSSNHTNGKYISLFISPSCPKCSPFKEQISNIVDSIKIKTINTATEEGYRLAELFNVQELPTAVIMSDEQEIGRFSTMKGMTNLLPDLKRLFGNNESN